MENNIYLKLAKARVEVQKKCTKKSGKNKFAGFEYFELKDFLTTATDEFLKQGLCAMFSIVKSYESESGICNEKAILNITDGKEVITFETPTAEANVKGANEIQNLGSKHTYLKRYLYMNALELNESDGVDATIGKEDKTEEKQTPNVAPATFQQIEQIKQLYTTEEIDKMLARMGKDFTQVTVVEASRMIKARKG